MERVLVRVLVLSLCPRPSVGLLLSGITSMATSMATAQGEIARVVLILVLSSFHIHSLNRQRSDRLPRKATNGGKGILRSRRYCCMLYAVCCTARDLRRLFERGLPSGDALS